ncbi:MAG: EamA family transporter [Thermoplasmata archaeon]|nr:EamA family transporter [Thermoplasmata archaeon]
MGVGAAVGYGLATAAGAGSADFLAKTTTDRVGFLKTLWYLELFGAPVLIALALWSDGLRPLPVVPLLGVLALALLSVGGLLFLYRAFELGRLSVVAPLTSGYPVLSVVLSVFVLGESLSLLALAGIVAVLSGVLLIARRSAQGGRAPKDPRAGIIAAAIAFVLFGFYYFGLAFVIGPVPPATGAALTRLVGLATVGGVVLSRAGPRLPPRSVLPRAVAFPVLDSLSLVAFNVGWVVSRSLAVLVTVSGLYGAVTLGWAVAVLHERPSAVQWGGALLIFARIAALSLGPA